MRTQPGFSPRCPSSRRWRIAFERVSSIARRRWPYGPAHMQPARTWIPKRSFRSRAARLWWTWGKITERTPRRRVSRLPRTTRSSRDSPGADRAGEVVLLDALRPRGPDGGLEVEGEARLDRLDDRRRPARLARLDRAEVAVVPRGGVEDRPAARLGRDAVREEAPVRDEEARRPRAPEELVDGEETASSAAAGITRRGACRRPRTGRPPRSRRTRARRAGGGRARGRGRRSGSP